MYDKLKSVIDESGIWQGERKNTHAFLLSPNVYQISREQHCELQKLGYALYDCLRAFSHMASIVYNPSHNYGYGGAWHIVRKVFATGVPLMYHELQGLRVGDIPRLLKLDFMVDINGKFRIAEIDGHNKHGIGYSTLSARLRSAVHPSSIVLPGVVNMLAQEVKRQGFDEIKIFYADRERFYLPEFEIVRDELKRYGIRCKLFSETEASETDLESGLFLDLPFLYVRKSLYDVIVPAYKTGIVKFVIPPKPFFGAKGVLALLRNDSGDSHIEAILRAFTDSRTLDLVRSYIPETLLVGKKVESSEAVMKRVKQKRYVLKESISSGMKGTVFSDGADFEIVLTRASKADMNWILQEEVLNQPQTFSWFENGEENVSDMKTESDWFMRVTAHYVNYNLADLIVTARRNKAVHGAKDCLQLGTVIV
ncbi:MAG: hypothetical protein AAB484_03185 [Patescibacteria group bacterium]